MLCHFHHRLSNRSVFHYILGILFGAKLFFQGHIDSMLVHISVDMLFDGIRRRVFRAFHPCTTVVFHPLEPIVMFFTRGTPNICGISTRLYIPFKFDVVLFLPVLHCFQFRHAFNTFNYIYNSALPAFETSLNKTHARGHTTHVSAYITFEN